jgi:hypothetical protein
VKPLQNGNERFLAGNSERNTFDCGVGDLFTMKMRQIGSKYVFHCRTSRGTMDSLQFRKVSRCANPQPMTISLLWPLPLVRYEIISIENTQSNKAGYFYRENFARAKTLAPFD